MLSFKPIISFTVSLIRPTLDILIYLKTQFDLQEIWLFYYTAQISKKINILIHGKTEEPCWEMGKIYNVNQGKAGMPIYIQKTSIGFEVFSFPAFLNKDNFISEKIKPCFISIRYISDRGQEFDIDLGQEFYLSGNELLSSGFVKWWIRTRFGVYWTNYCPGNSYKIMLMDAQLNMLELGPSDVVVLNKKEFDDGKQYKIFRYKMDNINEFEE